jgi:chromosomal replication initiation ATPase DnaA
VSAPRQLAFTFEHRSALGGADFLVTPSNHEAIAWLDAWPDWPAPLLVIHGPAGSGKSHLGQVFQARTAALKISASAIGPAAHDAREVWIDDAERGLAEEALLHLYTAVAARAGHILLTAAAAPSSWQIALPDLRSRILAAPAVALGRPDDALIMAVLAKLFSDRQVRVDVDVVEYLARRMERSLAEAQRLVSLIDGAALAERRDVTVPFVREILYRVEI